MFFNVVINYLDKYLLYRFPVVQKEFYYHLTKRLFLIISTKPRMEKQFFIIERAKINSHSPLLFADESGGQI